MIAKYIGIPYNWRRFNCWDYVVKVRKDNNIKTKMFKPRTIANAFQVITAEMQKLDHGLLRVDKPEDFDIVIAGLKKGERFEYHCGIFYGGDVSHCCSRFGSVINQSFNDFKNGYETISIWR